MTVFGSDDDRLHHGQGMGPAIQALLGVMGRDLVPPEDRRRIMDVAAAIPAALARNSFGVELRADAPDGGAVDLCVAMTRQEVADPACAAADGPWRRLWSDEAWGRVVQTIEAWRGGMFPPLLFSVYSLGFKSNITAEMPSRWHLGRRSLHCVCI